MQSVLQVDPAVGLPDWMIRQAIGGQRYPKRVKPVGATSWHGWPRHGYQPAHKNDPYWVELRNGNIPLSDYRDWWGHASDYLKDRQCRLCNFKATFPIDLERHKRASVAKWGKACSKMLDSVYELLRKAPYACVICNTGTFHLKWGVPLCVYDGRYQSCIEKWMFDSWPPVNTTLHNAIILAQKLGHIPLLNPPKAAGGGCQ